MNLLVDTNVLVRVRQLGTADCTLAEEALERLRSNGCRLFLTPQIIYEYWAVATRPIGANGLGIEPVAAREHLDQISSLFDMLDDEAGVFRIWRHLVDTVEVRGKMSHDTRLVASMRYFGLSIILTFNAADFRRFTGIHIISPAVIVAAPQGPLRLP